jgi:hypothetical protein
MSEQTAPLNKNEVDELVDRLDSLLVTGLSQLRSGNADETLMVLQEALQTAQRLPMKADSDESVITIEQLTKDERFLLEWLSKEDFSQYGECHGKSLDGLIAKGLAQLHGAETERNNTFIAKGDGIMFRAVSLTEKGWGLIKEMRSCCTTHTSGSESESGPSSGPTSAS